jgi:hypothetical protein
MIDEQRSANPLPWLATLIAAAWAVLIILHFASPAKPLPVESFPPPASPPAAPEVLNPEPGGVS